MLTFLPSKRFRFSFLRFSAFENNRSLGTLVASVASFFWAILLKLGNVGATSFQYWKMFLSLEIIGSFKYCSTSRLESPGSENSEISNDLCNKSSCRSQILRDAFDGVYISNRWRNC